MTTTYNKITKMIEHFAKHHKQINTSFIGKIWNFQSKENIFPALVAFPKPSSFKNGYIELKMSIFVADLIKNDDTNITEIHSDTLSIVSDFIGFFKDNPDYDFKLEADVSVEPFSGTTTDILAGWVASVTFIIDYDGSNCGIPGLTDSINFIEE